MHWAERWVPGSIGLLLTGIPTVIGLRLIYWSFASRRWHKAKGKVTGSRQRVVRQHRSTPGMVAEIDYRFEVDGKTYHGRRVLFGGDITINVGIARDLASKYPVGREVDVFYRSDDPRHCTLEQRASWFLVLFVLMGLAGISSIFYALLTDS